MWREWEKKKNQRKKTAKISKTINNSALSDRLCWHYDMLVQYASPEAAKLWKSTSGLIQDGGWPTVWNFIPFNIRHSPSIGSFKRHLKTVKRTFSPSPVSHVLHLATPAPPTRSSKLALYIYHVIVIIIIISTYLNCNNSAADCSISLQFSAEFGHVTAGTLQMFRVKGSRFKVTA